MKISDLSKIDIKDIDAAKLKEFALQHKEVVFQVVLVLVSLVVAITFFVKSQTEVNQYKSQINALKAKENSIDEYNQSQNQVKNYLNNIPKFVSAEQMIMLITDLAGQNGIKIVTFSPAIIENKSDLEATIVDFTLSANSFVQMVRFVSSIEKGMDFLQVWGCVVEPQPDPMNIRNNKKTIPLNFRIKVASLKVKS